MAIRVFINSWTEETNGNQVYVKDPIDEYLTDISLSASVESFNYYARISQVSKRPDRLYLLKIMRGDLQPSEWSNIGNIPGVAAIPPASFDIAISQINKPTENKIYALLDGNGISRTVYDSAATVGGFLRNLLNFTNPDENGFGELETNPGDWA